MTADPSPTFNYLLRELPEVDKVKLKQIDALLSSLSAEALDIIAEVVKLEQFNRSMKLPIGHPVYVFNKWRRIGTYQGCEISFQGKAVVKLELFTKDKVPYDYYVYDPAEVKPLDV